MHSPFVIFATLLLAGLSAAIPLHSTHAGHEATGKIMTIEKVSRRAHHEVDGNKTKCKYEMKLTVEDAPAVLNATAGAHRHHHHRHHAHCHFKVYTPSYDDDCRATYFHNVPCSRTDHKFMVSGGTLLTGGFGFIVRSVKDSAGAFFDYDHEDLGPGNHTPPKSSPLDGNYNASIADLGGNGNGNGSASASVSAEISADATWTVLGLTRRIDTASNAVHVGFTFLTDIAPGYNQKCQDSGFFVSWGYLPSSDAGIMTVVSPNRDREAFFGFPHISQSEELKPDGPGHAQACNC
ncbi:hypothetical protein F4802DRAFT_594475 [Xylaria palmicola]|nr:hypothetical protein F4802DRAFT_594475 [Xylaria palmicola]